MVYFTQVNVPMLGTTFYHQFSVKSIILFNTSCFKITIANLVWSDYNTNVIIENGFIMYSVNITSAKAHLSSLLRQIEDYNEEIIIERAGRPIAKIIKYKPTKAINRIGAFKNKIKYSEDFDQWPEDIAVKLGIKD